MISLWLVLLVVSIKWRESQILRGVSALIGLYFGLLLVADSVVPAVVVLGFNLYWLAMAVTGQKGL